MPDSTCHDEPEILERVRALDEELLESLPPSAPAGFDELVAALAAPAPRIRERAAEQLGLLGDARAIRSLRAAASDTDGRVRAAAVASLVRLGLEQLLPEVVKALRHDDPRVVVGAAVVLGKVGDRAAVPNLIEAYKTDDPTIGAAVAWALGCCADRAVVPWLIAALDQRFAPARAAEALGRLSDPRARAALLAAVRDSAEDVRAAAARALGRLETEPGTAREVAEALEPLLRDPIRRVRLCAAISLFELGEGSAQLERALDEQ